MEGGAPTAAPEARPRRWPKRLLYAALATPLVLIGAAVAALVFLPWIVTPERVRGEAVSALTGLLGTCVEIERVDYHPFTGVELFGVKVCPPPGFDRDLFTSPRIAARYDLSGFARGTVVVRELAIDDPVVVVETKRGKRNVDALQEHLSAGKAPKEDEPSGPLTGQVSPITLALDHARIGNATIELAGEGPRAKVTGLSVGLSAQLDPERLGALASLTFEAPKGGGPNVTAEIPAEADAPPLSASLALELAVTASVAARASDGLAFELAWLDAKLGLAADVKRGDQLVPRTRLDAALALDVRPREDRASLSKLEASLNGARIAQATAGIDGLSALVDALIGTGAALALGGEWGLARSAGEGLVRLSIEELALPLDALAPTAAALVPGTELGGKLSLGPILVEGTSAELMRGLPRTFELALVADRVRVTEPASGASITSMDGRITGKRVDDARAPFRLDGGVVLTGLRQQGNRVERADLGLAFEAERLAWPLPGRTRIAATLGATGIATPQATVARVKATTELEGLEAFAAEREASLAPVVARLGLEVDGVRAGSGTTAIDVSGVAMTVDAELDHVLTPASEPIAVKLGLDVGHVAMAGGTDVRRLHVDGTSSVTDPRTGRPLAARSDLVMTIGAASTPQADLEELRVRFGLVAEDIVPRTMAGEPRGTQPKLLPAVATTTLDVAMPKIVLRDPRFGAWTTEARMNASARADLVRGTVKLEQLGLELAKEIRIRSTIDVKNFLADDRDLDVKLDVDPIDLARLVALVPKALLEGASGIPSSGTFGLSLRARGKAPAPGAAFELARPPLDLDLGLRFVGIDLAVPANELDVRGFGGAINVGVRRGRTAITTALAIDRIEGGPKGRLEPIEGLVLTSTASLRGDVWELVARADQSRAADPARRNDTHVDIDVAYQTFGDVDIRRFDVKAPRVGVDLGVTGGLSRRRFGVLRPELSLRMILDLDRLRVLAPELGDASGGVTLALDVQSKTDELVDVRGRLELDRLSYVVPGLARVKNATGRIPIEQLIALPEPRARERGVDALGALGDDLELRIAELEADARAGRIYLDSDDILVEAPRAADYQPLRPYYGDSAARMTMEEVVYGTTALRNVSLEGLWRTGVFRIDRFAAQVWEGDVLADIAVQVTADQNVRARIRATVTDLNIDLPYAAANGIPPVSDPDRKDDYRISATMDFKFALRERSLNGTIDLSKLRKPTVERMIGAMDPKKKNAGIQNAVFALDMSETVGLRPTSGKIWISQNLMGMSLDWQRMPFQLKFKSPGEYLSWRGPIELIVDGAFVFLRPVFMLTAGSFIVDSVNNAFDKFSVSPWIEQSARALAIDEVFAKLPLKVTGVDLAAATGEGAGARTAAP